VPLDAISGRPRRAASLGGRDHWIADADSVVVKCSSAFARLPVLRIPGVVWTREQRGRLIVTSAPDASALSLSFFGFRTPARTVELLHRAARQRAGRGSRRLSRLQRKGRAA
jgi:hypothetical protein